VAAEPVDIKITISGHVEANTGFRLVAEGAKVASSAVAMFTKHLERASTLLNSSKFAPLVDSLARLRVGADGTTAALNRMAPAVQRIGQTTAALNQVAPAAQQAGQAIQRMSHHVHGGGTAMDYLRSQAQRLLLLLGTREVFAMMDLFTNAESRLRLVRRGAETSKEAMERLAKVAQDTKADFEATVELYARLGLATEHLDTGSEKLTRTVELVNKTLRISGAGAREAAAAVIQFAQALGRGTFGGDEFRSVMEQAPELGRQLAVAFGVTFEGLREHLRRLGYRIAARLFEARVSPPVLH